MPNRCSVWCSRDELTMNYGSLIRDAWTLTWRHRWLWVLGLFTGGGVGSYGNSVSYRTGPRDLGPVGPNASAALARAAEWVATHTAIVFAVVAILILVGLALLLFSLVCQGAMA